MSLCHYVTMSLCLCYYVTVTMSISFTMSLCLFHYVTVTMSISLMTDLTFGKVSMYVGLFIEGSFCGNLKLLLLILIIEFGILNDICLHTESSEMSLQNVFQDIRSNGTHSRFYTQTFFNTQLFFTHRRRFIIYIFF